jgi:hypothetical protein
MSSLGEFLNVMYKKRELEYQAKVDQAEADVAGAKAIGEGISSFGSAIGSIGTGIGGYMDKTSKDTIATSLAAEQGVNLAGGRPGSAMTEFDLRQKMGQLGANAMTPYQEAQLGIAKQNSATSAGRLDLEVGAANERRHNYLTKQAETAKKASSKSFTDTVNDTNAYLKETQANMAKLYDADTPEAFANARDYQISLNQGATKVGVDQSQIKKVPTEFIPKHTGYDPLPPSYQRYPEPTYAPGIGVVNPRTTGVQAPPQGSIPAPNFNRPVGTQTQMGGKNYKYDGNFFVPIE